MRPDAIVRPLASDVADEFEFVVRGMRRTLQEVEGDEVGAALCSLDWLRERVRFHLDAARSTGAVFVAQRADGVLVGHTIVRLEVDESGRRFGLISTTWVEPAARRAGVAGRLLAIGEDWMRAHALETSATWTSAGNAKLIALYAKHGYVQDAAGPNEQTGTAMVRLARRLA